MATYYVSQTATNGYTVGSSGNNGTSKTTPKLTIQQANALATHGDTIYVNDGTYAETSGSGFLDITNGITLLPETDYGVTLTVTAPSVYNVLRVAAAITRTITIGKIILDSDVQSTNVGLLINTSAGTININGTKIVTGSSYGIRDSSVDGDITLNGVNIYTTGNLNSPAYYTGLTKKSGIVTIQNSTFTLLTNQSSYTGITFLPLRETPTTFIFSGNTMTISSSYTNPALLIGVRFWGCKNFSATNNTITISDSAGVAGAAQPMVVDKYVRVVLTGNMTSVGTTVTVILANHYLENGDSIIVTGATQADYNGTFTITWVDANTFTYTALGVPAASPATGSPQFTENFLADSNKITGNVLTTNLTGGYCLRVGTEADDAGKSTITNMIISGNTFYAPNATTTHALLFGSNKGGIIYGNYIPASNLGLVIKNDIGSMVSGNVIKDCPNNAIYLKGATNSIAVNNTIIQTITQGGTYLLLSSSSTERNSTGITFANNLVYSTLATGTLFASNTSTSTGDTWKNNNYYSTGTLPSGAWQNAGINYNTLAAWQGAKESTAMSLEPGFLGTLGSSEPLNYRLKISSLLIGAGKDMFVPCKDYDGYFIPLKPSVGAFQKVLGGRYPIRQARTVI